MNEIMESSFRKFAIFSWFQIERPKQQKSQCTSSQKMGWGAGAKFLAIQDLQLHKGYSSRNGHLKSKASDQTLLFSLTAL